MTHEASGPAAPASASDLFAPPVPGAISVTDDPLFGLMAGFARGAAEYFVDLSGTVAAMAARSEHRGEFSFTRPPSDRGRPDAEKGSDFTRSKQRSIGRKVREVGQRDMPI